MEDLFPYHGLTTIAALVPPMLLFDESCAVILKFALDPPTFVIVALNVPMPFVSGPGLGIVEFGAFDPNRTVPPYDVATFPY